jgi:cytoskeletal protein CcmA (bactofilin family)
MFERGKKDGTDVGFSADVDSGDSGVSARSASVSGRDAAVIGRSIHINGDLRGEEDLRIEGDVNGTIQLKNNSLTIGQEGRIHADIYAKSIIVDGLVEGDLYGAERVGIRKNAQVRGNITAPSVSLEEGAKFKGSIEMDSEAVEAALGKPQSPGKPQPQTAPMSASKPGPANVGPTNPAAKKESVA